MSAKLKTIRIALAGNPNSGKTTLFNALTGAHHKVGNYPGVTVERREGDRIRNGTKYHFIDLPGIYSLTAYSMDEVVARDFLLDEKPDLIIDVLDSTNLERNLYLCLQFQELGIPVLGALNMTDEADAKGIKIDEKELSAILGLPMVKTVGSRSKGVDELLDGIDRLMEKGLDKDRSVMYGEEVELKLNELEAKITSDTEFCSRFPSRWLAVKLLEKDDNAIERLHSHKYAELVQRSAQESITWLEKHFGKDSEIIMSEQRYGYIRGASKEAVKIVKMPDFSVTEKIDKIIMHPVLALPIFLGVLWSVFQLTFVLGEYPMQWLESFFGVLSVLFLQLIPEGLLQSLIVDGIIAGVGGVFSFVPLIIILFFLLSILEDIGYMSRAAFATDKLLHSFGLHGQSVFPMMLGFGCSVPAIMAARTLKSRRDRIVTILIIPLMSCGAKLPVYVLLSAAFFPNHAANMVMLIYIVGVLLALLSSLVLKNTILRGEATPFVMELPPYRMPTFWGVLWHVWEKTWQYIKKAGTVILAASILIWVLTSFPKYDVSDTERVTLRSEYILNHQDADDSAIENWISTASAELAMENSYAGHVGRFIEPLVRPIGFDWKLAVATVTGFAAKEVVVSTLGILYRVGIEETEESEALRDALRRDPTFTPLLAFVLMLFTLVIPPCFASLAAIRAELGWGWLGFSFIFLLGLGWILGFIVFQIGTLAGLA